MNVFNVTKPLLEAINKVLLNEHEMTRREVNMVDDKFSNHIAEHKTEANSISGHVFGDHDRIVIPLSDYEHPTKTAVESHLNSHGYNHIDYLNGMAIDKHSRIVSIGKTLAKTGATKELIDNYAEHRKTYPDEAKMDTHSLQVVISKHPHDVIGMSQGTEWGIRAHEKHLGADIPTQSCMRFDTYQHETHIPYELKHGTHIAWLTHKGDNEAKEPISRISLRPYSTNDDEGSNNEPKYSSYKFTVNKRDRVYKNAVEQKLYDEDSDNDAFEQHIAYAMDSDAIPSNESFHHATVTDHHNSSDYAVVHIHLNKPKSFKAIKSIHQGLSDELSHHSSDPSVDGIEPEHWKDKNAAPEHKILVPGSKIYGQHSDTFKNVVDTWAKTHFAPHKDVMYHAKPGIYLDGDSKTLVG
jgi:hypothetical protein